MLKTAFVEYSNLELQDISKSVKMSKWKKKLIAVFFNVCTAKRDTNLILNS
jgi:hypothetical protein